MALNFEGTSAILNLALGGISLPGNISIALIARMQEDTERAGLVGAYDVSNLPIWGLARRGSIEGTDPNLLMYGAGGGNSRAGAFNIADGWCVVGVNKAVGSTIPRFHKITMAGVATHSASAVAVGNGTGTPTKIVVGAWGDGDTTQFSGVDIALVGLWNTSLSDANFASLVTNLAAWKTLSPLALVPFESMQTLPDLTGTSSETSRTGTTILDSPEPFLQRRIKAPKPTTAAVRRAAYI